MVFTTVCLGSCGSDDAQESGEEVPVPESGKAIVFAASQQEETSVTRAESPLSAHVQFFKVYGFKNMTCDNNTTNDPNDDVYSDYQQVFPGYVVNWTSNSAGTSTTNSAGWEYVGQQRLGETEQTVKYWDYSAKAYRFFAIAGAKSTNEVKAKRKTYNAGTANEYVAYELTYEADANNEAADPTAVPYYSHLWFSNGNTVQGFQAFGNTVGLQFIKPFSKVRFAFIFEEPDKASETELTEKSFAPTDGNTIKTNGNVTVSYPITGTLTQETFSVDAETSGLPAFSQDYYESISITTFNQGQANEKTVVTGPYYGAPETPLGKEYTVLPAKDQGTYTLKVNVNGDPKEAVVPANFMEWKPGYQYTYIFKIHVDGSVSINAVQSAFTEWIDHPTTHTIYNW